MASKYYVARNGQPTGPYSIEELVSQSIKPDALVWNESMPNWVAASTVAELAPLFAVPGAQNANSDGYQSAYSTQPNNDGEICPKTWLAESIIATILCCVPFGIVGIIFASGVEGKFRAGDMSAG